MAIWVLKVANPCINVFNRATASWFSLKRQQIVFLATEIWGTQTRYVSPPTAAALGEIFFGLRTSFDIILAVNKKENTDCVCIQLLSAHFLRRVLWSASGYNV